MPLFMTRVYAAAEDKKNPKMVEISMYDNPESKIEYTPENISKYRERVSTVRKSVFEFGNKHEAKIDRACQIWSTSCAHTQDLAYKIWENKERSAIIAAAGLTGVIVARGRYMRGAVYGTGAAVVAASLCFPNETVDVVKNTGKSINAKIVRTIKGDKGDKGGS